MEVDPNVRDDHPILVKLEKGWAYLAGMDMVTKKLITTKSRNQALRGRDNFHYYRMIKPRYAFKLETITPKKSKLKKGRK